MRKSAGFSNVLEATERLSLEERETLLKVLQHSTIEERRARLKRDVLKARREHAAGKTKPASARQIMKALLK